jgi:hypothetical protein
MSIIKILLGLMAFRGELAFKLSGQAFLAKADIVEELQGFEQMGIGG